MHPRSLHNVDGEQAVGSTFCWSTAERGWKGSQGHLALSVQQSDRLGAVLAIHSMNIC